MHKEGNEEKLNRRMECTVKAMCKNNIEIELGQLEIDINIKCIWKNSYNAKLKRKKTKMGGYKREKNQPKNTNLYKTKIKWRDNK